MVTREVLRSRIVHNVRTKLERSLQVRREHRVIDNSNRVFLVSLDELRNLLNIRNLKKRVRRRFEEDHGDLDFGILEEGKERFGLGGVDVVGGDAVVLLEVADETVRATVEVVAGDDVVSRLEKAEDHVESAHAGGDSEGVAGGGDLGDVVFCGRGKG